MITTHSTKSKNMAFNLFLLVDFKSDPKWITDLNPDMAGYSEIA